MDDSGKSELRNRAVSVMRKALARLRMRPGEGGLAGAKAALRRVASPSREAILFRADLTTPTSPTRSEDASVAIRLAPFDAKTATDAASMAQEMAPAAADQVVKRLRQKAQGYVGYRGAHPVGFVFSVRGAYDPLRIVHPDLRWLGLRPTFDELYMYDPFVRAEHRDLGPSFLRAVQTAYDRAGFKRAYGYAYADANDALELYQATGWTEVGRVRERRFAQKLALVDGTFYWLSGSSRRPVWSR